MKFDEMNVEQLEARLAELTEETSEEKRDALDNDALEARQAAAAKAEEERQKVAQGNDPVTKTFEEEKTMTLEELRKSKEYVEAYAEYLKKRIRGEANADAECRALLTTNATAATGYVPVPTLVDDIVRHAWENENILSRVKKTGFTGNVALIRPMCTLRARPPTPKKP